MKKSTGIVFLLAVLLGCVAYFYDWRHHPTVDVSNSDSTVKMAFTVQEDNITSINITRMGMTMVLERKDDGWYITQPIATRADQMALQRLTHDLTEVIEDRTVINPTAAQLNTYGLTNPAVILQFKTADGMAHTLRIGTRDFSNLEVYSQIDNSKDVTLVANAVAKSSDRSLEDFRDHSALLFSMYAATAFDLHNSTGEIAAEKDGTTWMIEKPLPAPGGTYAITNLFNAIQGSSIAKFVSDDPAETTAASLAKYGLSNPSIRFTVSAAAGKTASLLLGKKDGIEYFAMDDSRKMIFRVPDSLYTKLNQKFADLRARVLYTGLDEEVTHVDLHGPHGAISCLRTSAGNMIVTPSGDQASGAAPKDPENCPDFLTPLERAAASALFDQPPADLAAKLAKPEYSITLTQQANAGNVALQASSPAHKVEISISQPSGNSVYARSNAGPTIYQFPKEAFASLSEKPSAP